MDVSSSSYINIAAYTTVYDEEQPSNDWCMYRNVLFEKRVHVDRRSRILLLLNSFIAIEIFDGICKSVKSIIDES
jgi:hypothetical protein